VYRRILGPVYENKKENWSILTNKEMYEIVKKSTITSVVYEFGNNKTKR
jgi:hypothetical protein